MVPSISAASIAICLTLIVLQEEGACFQTRIPLRCPSRFHLLYSRNVERNRIMKWMCPLSASSTDTDNNEDSWNDEGSEIIGESEDDLEILFGDDDDTDSKVMNNMEKTWRYAKKPLLSIGAKGASFSHGNSLRQLLEAHTVVKVKVNTKQFGTLEKAFEDIRDLAVESGAPEGIELLQARDKEKVILFGMPGTRQQIEEGNFPPLPAPPKD